LTAPLWAWVAFLALVAAMLLLDLIAFHRQAHEVSMREAGIWSGIWIGIGLGFGGLLWAWAGSATAQAHLAGYLIEKSLSVDNDDQCQQSSPPTRSRRSSRSPPTHSWSTRRTSSPC
jgi:tellurite resistance protein TerC